MSKRYRLAAWLLTAALVLCACAGPEPETAPSTGNIRLYGETHGQQDLLDRELELWRTYYGEGERHLFVELAYYESFGTKREAMQREWEIKRLSRKDKLKLFM